MVVAIPESHRDLVDGPFDAALTTIMPDGHPQTTPIWCSYDGTYVLINTMRGFRKEKNMRQNPRVSLLIFDRKCPFRHLEVRGVVVEMTEDGALDHLDELTQLYMNRPNAKFFGDSVPAELQETHHPVKIKIEPTRVRVEG
ncbi:MAG: PPOX class F420-dependent oxidoreductase [Anaerolineae bacterium]|nr:PPOX class F420-dependent oxidoreductase [Anaerolineae bacterium]